MTLWMVRAGRHGEWQDLALEQNLVAVGWPELSDLSQIGSREALADLCLRIYEEEKRGAVQNRVAPSGRRVMVSGSALWACFPATAKGGQRTRNDRVVGRLNALLRGAGNVPGVAGIVPAQGIPGRGRHRPRDA